MKKFYIILEKINFQLFLLINVSEHPNSYIVNMSIFFSRKLIFLFPMILLSNLFSKEKEMKKSTIFSIFSTNLSMILNILLRSILQHPRPFMIPIGRSLFYHFPNSSIPSNHASFSFSVSISLISQKNSRLQGYILLILSTVISVSRIYDGIHFPLDVVASIFISILCTLISKLLV